jgi:hypothetical protein
MSRLTTLSSNRMPKRPLGFTIAFGIAIAMFVAIFITAVVIIISVYSGNSSISYHYEVDYQNGQYSETTTWDN